MYICQAATGELIPRIAIDGGVARNRFELDRRVDMNEDLESIMQPRSSLHFTSTCDKSTWVSKEAAGNRKCNATGES